MKTSVVYYVHLDICTPSHKAGVPMKHNGIKLEMAKAFNIKVKILKLVIASI